MRRAIDTLLVHAGTPEPRVRGGTNTGPSPTETLMSALIACTNVITHKIAAKHGIPVVTLESWRLDRPAGVPEALLIEAATPAEAVRRAVAAASGEKET